MKDGTDTSPIKYDIYKSTVWVVFWDGFPVKYGELVRVTRLSGERESKVQWT